MPETDILSEEIIIDLFESYKVKADGILATCSLVREDSRLEVVPLQFALANYVHSSLKIDGRLFRSYAMSWAHDGHRRWTNCGKRARTWTA